MLSYSRRDCLRQHSCKKLGQQSDGSKPFFGQFTKYRSETWHR